MATMKKVERKGKKVSYKISFVHPETGKWTSKTVRSSYKDALRIKAEIESDLIYGLSYEKFCGGIHIHT